MTNGLMLSNKDTVKETLENLVGKDIILIQEALAGTYRLVIHNAEEQSIFVERKTAISPVEKALLQENRSTKIENHLPEDEGKIFYSLNPNIFFAGKYIGNGKYEKTDIEVTLHK